MEATKMKSKTGLVLSTSIILFASTLSHAFGSDEEAVRLQKLFSSYLTDTKGVVEVKTDGDGYVVRLDFNSLAAQSNGTVKITPVEFKMASQGNGKWQVVQDQVLTLTMDLMGEGAVDEKIGSLKVSGIFDENLNYFSKLTGQATDISLNQKMNDPNSGAIDISATVKSVQIDQTGAPAANGGVDVVIKYAIGNLVENINTAGKPESGMPPMNLIISSAGGNYDLDAKGFKAIPFLDGLAFFIAHQSKELIGKDQVKLKTTLKDALPVWESMLVNAKLNNVSVASQYGQFGVDSVEIVADVNGITKDGKLREKMAFNGVSLPNALIPPWATKLVPKNVSFDFTVSGFDLASPAQMILDQLDLAKEPPLPDGFEQVLMPAFMPKGIVDVTLNPTTFDNDTYSFKVEGSLAAGPAALPTGKAKISAKGLDEVMKIIQEAPPEAGLQQGAALVVVAKGMAKAETDGSLTWNIESSPDGKVLVNGIDPTKLR